MSGFLTPRVESSQGENLLTITPSHHLESPLYATEMVETQTGQKKINFNPKLKGRSTFTVFSKPSDDLSLRSTHDSAKKEQVHYA